MYLVAAKSGLAPGSIRSLFTHPPIILRALVSSTLYSGDLEVAV
jgi:hypothetical protein